MTLNILILVLIVAGFGGVAFLLIRLRRPPDDAAGQPLVLLQNQINEITRTLDLRLGGAGKARQSQFGESNKIIGDVRERLAKLDETNRQVVGFADQLQGLQDILRNPKQRGVLGEYYLETVLKNVLPPGSYKMQYGFKDGTIVDAVVKVKEKI